MAASMAASLFTFSHRPSIRPKPFSFSLANKPISLSLPILPSPSLSLAKIHCSPPDAEDSDTYSDEEEEVVKGDEIYSEEEEEEEVAEGDKTYSFKEEEVTEGTETYSGEEEEEEEPIGPDEDYEPFTGPLFDEIEETEEETWRGFEQLYGTAFSGASYIEGNDVNEMDSKLVRMYDEYGNLVVKRPSDDFEERLLEVRRVTKVVKGGKNMGFRALAVVGDKQGHVGVGVGKALDVADAVVKAVINGRRNIVTIPLTKDKTFYHKAEGSYGSAKVMLKPATPGSGVLAGPTVTAILELAGVENALGKQLRSKNAMNNARATIVATQMMKSWAQVSQERGLSVEEMLK